MIEASVNSSSKPAAGARVSFAEIVSDRGHDAFLLDEPEMHAILSGFIDAAARARRL